MSVARIINFRRGATHTNSHRQEHTLMHIISESLSNMPISTAA